MFVVIFEVQPKRERWDVYLETAGLLRPVLERIDGFVDNERFRSQRTEGRILSLSTWRDEKALIRWRTQATHHLQGQQRGRADIFADYHLRVGEVTFDTDDPAVSMSAGHRFDVTEVGASSTVTITEERASTTGATSLAGLATETPGLVDQELFESITLHGKRLLLASWADDAPIDRSISPLVAVAGTGRQRRVRIIRDYGMRDRREAPQYFPDVP
jgi:heme-degrading monooxygenase HmoA